MYIHICIYIHIYIYIPIDAPDEPELSSSEGGGSSETLPACVFTYTMIYHIYTELAIYTGLVRH